MNIVQAPIAIKYEGPDRVYLLPDGGTSEETDAQFLLRMKEAQDVLWIDLERAEKLIPAFDDAVKARKNIREALEGIAAGGKMKLVIADAGFPFWGDFHSHAMNRAKCINKLFLLAKEERHKKRLNEAEDALHERAVEGIDEPIVNHLGQIIGYKKKYSDSLLQLQLKALDPDTYSDRNRNEGSGLIVNVQMGLRSPEEEKPAEGILEDPPLYNGMEGLEMQESDDSEVNAES